MRVRLTYFIFIAALLFFGNIKAFAQISNTGVKLFLDRNAVMHVKGNFKHHAGEVLNNGTITVEGEWESHNKVFEDASTGTVVMNSTLGSVYGMATFPNLVFKGNRTYNLKGKFDARLSLSLEDSEIQLTSPETLRLLNTNPLSLTRNNGYITSLRNDGSFVRFMDADEDYLYPMGTSTLKRFVVIKPAATSLNSFAVTFVDSDPNTEGFNRLNKSKSVGEVNDAYYHKIKRLTGTSAIDVTFLMPSSVSFTGLAAWVKNIQWDRMISSGMVNSGAAVSYTAQSMLHKNANLPLGSEVPFALAQVTNTSPLEFYNAFSPDGDGKNDTWEVKNIDAFPDNDLKIFDRSGNLVYRMNGYSSSKYWDGQNVASGTYIYVLRVKIDGKDQQFKGSITMVKN